MEPINIAVIGAEGVGKSTFIQHLRRAPRPSTLNITTLRHELDGAPYLVTLVELDLEGIELDPNQPVHWPKQIGGHMVPRMDGALILYHAVNEETMREVPPIMGESLSRTDRLVHAMLIGIAALANSSLPTVLVATKCDTPDDLRHPDLAGLASAFATCAGHFRTASNAPGSARECLQAMLRVALANRRGEICVLANNRQPHLCCSIGMSRACRWSSTGSMQVSCCGTGLTRAIRQVRRRPAEARCFDGQSRRTCGCP